MTPQNAGRERELRLLLEAERAADEAAAPSLQELLLRAAPARPSFGAGGLLIRAAAAVIAIVVTARLVHSGGERPRPRDRSSAAMTLAEWRSPTEFLLETPGSEIWTEVPSLGSAPTVPAPSPTKGVQP